MRDIGIIFRAEFARKIRSRPFLIGTIIGALAIVGLAALPSFVTRAFDSATRRIVLAGEPSLVASAASLLSDGYDIVARVAPPSSPPTLADLNTYRRAAAFIIIERRAGRVALTAYARDPANFDGNIARDLVPLNIAAATNLPLTRVKRYLKIETRIHSLDTKFANPASAQAAQGIAYILVLLLYMSILLNSQTVMASVAEEKTSRIAETLVAATSPARLLTAKIFAAGALGLIQLAIWIGVGVGSGAGILGAYGGNSVHRGSTALNFGAVEIPGAVIAGFIVFFIIGFLQYATLYAAAASLINRTEDLSSVAAPLVVPVIGGFFLAQYALAFPHATHVAVLSVLPLVSPFVMFTRMTVTTVPAWQVALALVVNIATTILILWGAGKVYRVGLLLYGRPPSLRQVIAALRA